MTFRRLKPQPLLALCLIALAISPAEANEDSGFSYFLGTGAQHVVYKEVSSIVPVVSEATANSPILISGALYKISDDFLFSLNSENTFYPSETTERWTSTQSGFLGTTDTNRLLQSNLFTYSSSNTDLLAHYRAWGPVFLIGGPTLRNQSFKRYAFRAENTNVVIPPGTVEESTGEIILNLGFGIDSEQLRNAESHYGIRAYAGLPIWRRVRNTQFPDVEFASTKGWDLGIEGRYSRAIHSKVHVGLWGKYSVAQRDREVIGNTELPDNRTENLSYGVELLWKL